MPIEDKTLTQQYFYFQFKTTKESEVFWRRKLQLGYELRRPYNIDEFEDVVGWRITSYDVDEGKGECAKAL